MSVSHSAHPEPAATMEVVLPGVVSPAGLQLRRRLLPPPGPGQVRIAVEATGVSFAEQQMRRGRYFDQPPFPFVPGYDLVGTVSAVGEGVEPGMVGRRYAALTKTGGWASDVVLDAADLVPVPVIASGGAGTLDDFVKVLSDGNADAALAASLFHDGVLRVGDVKTYVASHGIPIRDGG